MRFLINEVWSDAEMTNKEKFMEVFGLEPDTLFCPIKSCFNCPYYDNGCDEKNRANFYNLKYMLNKKDIESKTGHWIESRFMGFECSECGKSIEGEYSNSIGMVPFNFCPNCGAKMQESEEV